MTKWISRIIRPQSRRAPRARAPRIRVESLEAREVPATSVFSFSAATYSVGESGGLATITVTRTISGTGANPTKVNYFTADGTATAGSDYTATSGTVNFGNDQTVKTFTVPALADNLVEGNETINLSLTPVNAGDSVSPTNGTAVLTIVDDDTTALSVSDVSWLEGQTGQTAFNFTVSLSNPSTQQVTVDYATADGTATAGSDYTGISPTTLTFAPGETTKTVTVNVLADHTPEGDETFFVNLSNATNAGIADGQGLGTIQNDDTAPVADADAYSVSEDGTLNIAAATGVLANDIDAQGDPLSAVEITGPAHGTLVLNADGSFTYTPAADFNGTDSFTYLANDGFLDSGATTVTITVSPVNDAPVANDQGANTNEDADLTGAVSATDVDGDALTYSQVDGPAHGTLVLNADGSCTYTPDADFNGTDSFTYLANDGTVDSNLATVTITVNPVNDPPVAVDQGPVGTDEDTALSGTVTATDVDGDSLTYVLVDDAANGSVVFNPDGSFTYTPDADFNGTDSFTYMANDGTADSNVATVTFTVNPVNDTPVAADQGADTDEDTALTGAVSATDVDGDGLTYTLVDNTTNGSVVLNADGSFTYTPAVDFNGTDSFTYMANDGTADSNLAIVTITVNPVNDAPVAGDDTAAVIEDHGPVTVVVLANDSPGPDAGDSLTVTQVTQGANGTVTIDAGGQSVTYTPAANFFGIDSFQYTVTDSQGATVSAVVQVTVANDFADHLEVGTSAGNATFTEGQGRVFVDPGIVVGSDGGPIRRATVQITGGYVRGKDFLGFVPRNGIHAYFNQTNGKLVLWGKASPAAYQDALRRVRYRNPSVAPVDGVRTITFQLFDRTAAGVPATRGLQVIGVNSKPRIPYQDVTWQYHLGSDPIHVAPYLRVRDIDNTILTGATLQIGTGFTAGDMLTFTAQAGISGTYNAATGELTFTGSASKLAYQTLLRSVRFSATTVGLREIQISVTDGIDWSNTRIRRINAIA